jgi:hypothetical protein
VRKYETSDLGFLWAAYKNKSFPMPDGLNQEEFVAEMVNRFGAFNLLWIIEDDNEQFKSGKGQISLVGIKTDGWTFEPMIYFFKWATDDNILRAAVAFFHMLRYKKEVGVCLVKAIENEKFLYDKMKDYGVLHFRGRIPYGLPQGDAFVYSINGRKGI